MKGDPMANFTKASATQALNEDQYINKLYDTGLKTNQDTLSGYYKDNTALLDAEQKRAQSQTADYVARTNVEADKAAGSFQETPRLSRGAQDQEALTRWNQRQADVTALGAQQTAADAEIERQRNLLAQEYQRAIQKAQADNDMQRAQALYEAAQAEEDQLLSLRKEAAAYMSSVGDTSLLRAMRNGSLPKPDTASESWPEVLKNEEAINKIYDAQARSQRLEQEGALERKLSDLYAQRDKAERATDRQLTQAYVNAQKQASGQNERLNASGLSSGAQAQAGLARDMGLQAELTRLRTLQADSSTAAGVQGLDLARTYRDAAAKQQAQTEQDRAKALYDAAEGEEQRLIDTQRFLGKQFGQYGSYGILGKLYGLTKDQIDRLQGTGAYAWSGGDGGYSSGSPADPDNNIGSLGDRVNGNYQRYQSYLKDKKSESTEKQNPTPAIQNSNPELIKWINGLR